MHEMLHSLGQAHEQSRPDRDSYVSVNFAKIQAGMENNFQVQADDDVARPYDMLSVMHYEATAFSTDGSATITTKPAAYRLYTNNSAEFSKYSLGNRIGPTQLDVDQLAAQARAQSPVPARMHPCARVLKRPVSLCARSVLVHCKRS
jgi:hypothetical protein